MADSAAFEAACARLEERSALDRMDARGTIRIVLKKAGLDPKSVTARELAVAMERLLPAALAARGVADAQAVSGAIQQSLTGLESRSGDDTPEAIFARLARS
jgi:hypothetical protein